MKTYMAPYVEEVKFSSECVAASDMGNTSGDDEVEVP